MLVVLSDMFVELLNVLTIVAIIFYEVKPSLSKSQENWWNSESKNNEEFNSSDIIETESPENPHDI